MRQIDYIVIHCTATSPTTPVVNILNYWRDRLGWKNPGYHRIITSEGFVQELLPLDKVSNGVRGYNSNSVHISYVGGIDKNGKAKDTRTKEQLKSMELELRSLHALFPLAKIQGHKDFPGVHKACPSFDVAAYLKTINL